MKVNIVYGPSTDINIKHCYDILVEKAKKELQQHDRNICKGKHRGSNERLRPKQSD